MPAERPRLAPLVVLVPSLATVVVAAFAWGYSRGSAIAAVGVIALGFAATLAVGSRTYDRRRVLGTAALTLGAGVLATGILVLWQLGAVLSCGETLTSGWLVAGVASGSLVHLTTATAGFRAKRPLVAVLFGLILGLIAVFLVLSAAPHGQIPDCST